jgi:hypothetical protein
MNSLWMVQNFVHQMGEQICIFHHPILVTLLWRRKEYHSGINVTILVWLGKVRRIPLQKLMSAVQLVPLLSCYLERTQVTRSILEMRILVVGDVFAFRSLVSVTQHRDNSTTALCETVHYVFIFWHSKT